MALKDDPESVGQQFGLRLGMRLRPRPGAPSHLPAEVEVAGLSGGSRRSGPVVMLRANGRSWWTQIVGLSRQWEVKR